MDEEEDDTLFEEKPSPPKLSRKVGEKLRRDRLNSLITQLAEEIPIIKYAHRRLDKSAILRLTVSFMKLHLGLKRKKLGGSVNLSGGGLLNWLKKVTDDVLLILSQSGTIIYVSPKIIDLLGFYQTDMVGHNIERFIHPDDLDALMLEFSISPDVNSRSTFNKLSPDSNSSGSDQCQMSSPECKSFGIRMLKAARRKQMIDDTKEYEMICVQANCENSLGVGDIKSTVDEKWILALLKPFSQEPIREVDVKISEFMKNNEWASMHDLDSKIIANDHRASLFHGFLVSEILGKTPYMLICEDDLESVAASHQMIMKNHQIRSTVFRMNNKFDMTIYIQSESIIVKDNWTKKPKCIVSVNRVLSSEEGRYLLESQKKITSQFLEFQKIEGDENLKQVKQEVELEDETDSCKMWCDEPSKSPHSFHQNKKTVGMNLKEIYHKKSKNFPDLYVSSDNCSNAGSVCDSEKRSFESIDDDSSDLGSTSSATSLSNASSMSGLEEPLFSPKYKSPSLKDLLCDENSFMRGSSDFRAVDISKNKESLPLLKGMLQGNVKIEEGLSSAQKSRDSDENYNSPRKIHVREFISSAVPAKENGASCVTVAPWSKGTTESHAAAGHIGGIQSPTVGSSEVGPVASSAESTVDPTSVKSHVYCRFTSQLVQKHSMLKQTIDSQKCTLGLLREQLQKSHNSVVLSSQQKKVHDSLIKKISVAEAQVAVQCELLEDLKQEIVKQQI